VAPLTEEDAIAIGDVVLCKVNGQQYLHLVRAVANERYQIANNRGHINGWAGRAALFGRLTSVSD